MKFARRLKQWVWDHRHSTRMAYALQLGSRAVTSALSLMWIPLMVGAMGKELYATNLAFQRIITLGGLGDLGMGGAVGIRAGQHLGRGEQTQLQQFLASARTLFLGLAVSAACVVMLLSPWLPRLLKFTDIPGVGSSTLLFAVGAALVAGFVIASYLNNLNYACGNVTWPVIPTFLLLQVGLFGQWTIARMHQPLWIQWLPMLATAAAGIAFTRLYIRASHPAIAGFFPFRADWRLAATLMESSFWIYLCSLGNAIYRSTDAVVIQSSRSFDPGTLTWYDTNYRPCEIAVFLALTASFVSLPKITQWMSSTQAEDQARARAAMTRLNQFQTLLGCATALGYLAGIDGFMRFWASLGHMQNAVPPAPPAVQLAFALNMAVTASGDAGIQLGMRSGSRGLRAVGIMIGCTGLLNLVLAVTASHRNWLAGIPLATVAAQSVLSLAAGFFTCRHMRVAWLPWTLRAWLFPVVAVLAAAWLRQQLPLDSAVHVVIVAGAYAVMLAGMAWSLGITPAFIRSELSILRKLIG